MGSALYVFGFVPKGTLPRDLEIDGIEPDHTVIQEELSTANAVVSYVQMSEFVGEEAELRLQDIEWVAPRAVKHQCAIEKILEVSPVLPAQFGVLFSSRDNLEKFVQSNHAGNFGIPRVDIGQERVGRKSLLGQPANKTTTKGD